MRKKMKVIFLTLAFYCLSTMVFSQVITLNISNVSVKEAIRELKDKTGYSFAYEVNDLDTQRKISVKSFDKPIDEVVKQILIGQNVNYIIDGKNIIISKSKKSTSGFLNNQKSKKITGLVTDEKGEPIIGASVLLKGEKIGAITSVDGSFLIEAYTNSILSISYVGYQSREININDQTSIKIELSEKMKELDEVVVVGYGTQLRSKITGSVSSINAEKINNTPLPNFEKALQGNASGLQISSSNGSPEGASRILIRGTHSITAGTEPLIIVDGVPMSYGSTSFLAEINPSDIENVSILKDASSAAMYGSRGANGVILVTTKSGKKGVQNLSFSFDAGYMKPINTIALANADEWRSMVELARTNSGLAIDNTTMNQYYADNLFNPNDKTRFISNNVYGTVSNDWYDKVISNGSYEQYGLSASNATDKANYYVSGQYRTQKGNFIGEKYDKYTFRMNLSFKPTNYLELSLKNNLSYQDIDRKNVELSNGSTRTKQNTQELDLNTGGFSGWNELYGLSLPIYPVYWPGTSEPFDQFSGSNIVYSNSGNSLKKNKKLNGLTNASISITPFKGFLLKGEVGIDYREQNDLMWTSDRIRYDGRLKKSDGTTYALDDPIRWKGQSYYETTQSNYLNFIYNGVASYNMMIDKKNEITLLGGIEAIEDFQTGLVTTMQGTNIARPDVEDYPGDASYLDTYPKMLKIDNRKGNTQRFFSLFGKINYDYDKKYLFQASIRRDGSSKFSPENRFAIFPAISTGWVISSEKFYKVPVVEYLKIKASWGKTGNAAIPGFRYYNTYNMSFGNYAGTTNSVLTRIGSGDVRWELSTTTDVGLDFRMLNGRISGSIGYYNNLTSDMLLDIPLTLSVGTYDKSSALSNIGKLENQGIELSISTVNVDRKNFTWKTDFNFSTTANKVKELYPGFTGSVPSQLSSNGNTAVMVGEAIGTFYLPLFAGYDDKGFSTIYEIDQTKTGQYIYDKTGNVIRPNDSKAGLNRVLLRGKTGLPTFYGGLTNTFTYKNFSLSMLLTYQGGNYILENAPGKTANIGLDWMRKELYNNTWTPENPNAAYPKLTWNNKDENNETVNIMSDKWLKKGDFIRLKTLTMNYTVPKEWIPQKYCKSVGLYVNLDNIATWSYIKGFDPEMVSGGDEKARNTTQGIIGGIPYFQTFTASLGAKINF